MDGNGSNRFDCVSSTCKHSSSSHNNLLRHYRENPSHRSEHFTCKERGRPKESSADDVVSSIFHDQLPPQTRSSRAKAFASKLTTDELKKYCLPLLTDSVKPCDYISEYSSEQTSKIANCFVDTRNSLALKYPELVSTLYGHREHATSGMATTSSDSDLHQKIDENRHSVCEYILNPKNTEVIFKDILMRKFYQKHKDVFLEFGCGVVGSLGVSQRDTQDLLRNTWGAKLEQILGFNIFPPKDTIVHCLNNKKDEISQQVGLRFEEKGNGIVVVSVNVQKYLEFLLSKPGVYNSINFPNKALLIYQFTDLAPWLKWSRFSTGITTLRIKVVEPYNLHSLVITCGVYLGKDDYDTLSLCFKDVYEQITNLKEVHVNNTTFQIHHRATADGKQRRVDTGNSSARSTYPICDAPEHCSQLGDLTLCSKGPEWSIEDTRHLNREFSVWLNGRVESAQTRREFAKLHLGSQGRINLVCNLSEYYIGGIHLAFRSLESICHRIGQCAIGFLNSATSYYEALSKLARNVKKEDGTVKFDEIGVSSFSLKMPCVLKEAGFTDVPQDILTTFTSGVDGIYTALLDTPIALTGCQFECLARLHLGFQFVLIFGTSCITPSIKQIVTYTPFYIDKARSDGNLVGLPLRFSNFSDGSMETAHKYAKQGTFLYSGGRHGATSATEYQKLILSQLFHHEFNRISQRESTATRSSESKVSRKRNLPSSSIDDNLKKRKHLPFQELQHRSTTALNDVKKKDSLQPNSTFNLENQVEATCNDSLQANSTFNLENQVEGDEMEQTTYLSSEDIQAISSQRVQTSNSNINELKQTILEFANSNHSSQSMNYITKTFAESYGKQIANQPRLISFHADKCKVNDEVMFERSDPRVSKEILNCKIHLNPTREEIIVDHHQEKSKERHRLRIYFNHVMAIAVCDQSLLVLDTCRYPIFEIRVNNKWAPSARSNTLKSSKYRIEITSHQILSQDLLHKLSTVEVLETAVKTSLKECYPEFTPFLREKPYQRLPILKDPDLVRAVQLAILEVAKDPRSKEDVEFVVKMFTSIQFIFRQMLENRLQSSENHEE